MKSFPYFLALSSLLCSMMWTPQTYAAQPLSLAQAVAAVQKHPSLLASKSNAEAFAFKPTQTGGLPDPVLSVGAVSFPTDSFERNQENMTQLQVGISQAFPFPGTLGLAAESDEHLAEAAKLDVDELRLQLISRVQSVWWRIFYLDRALETVERNKQLLQQLIRIAQSKYKTGKGLQQDVLLAQLELSKLLDVDIQLIASRKQEVAKLNRLLNQPPSQFIMLQAQVGALLQSVLKEEDLQQYALAHRPMLIKQTRLIEAAEAKVALADKAFYPDFKLGATYGFRAANPVTNVDRADLASITLSMSLPFFSETKDAGKGEQQAALARQGFVYQDVQQAVTAEITQLLARYEQAKSQTALFQSGIIPQAKQTVASMRAAYQVNKVDFLNLIRAQITLYNYETQYWKAFADGKQILARLDAVIGKTTEIGHE